MTRLSICILAMGLVAGIILTGTAKPAFAEPIHTVNERIQCHHNCKTNLSVPEVIASCIRTCNRNYPEASASPRSDLPTKTNPKAAIPSGTPKAVSP